MSITDRELRKIEIRISRIYVDARKGINRDWYAFMEKASKEVEELQKAYDEAKKSGDKKEIRKAGRKLAQAQREVTIQDKKFRDMVEQTARRITYANKVALDYVNGQMPKMYTLGYNEFPKEVKGLNHVKGYSFTMVDENTIKSLITEKSSLLPAPSNRTLDKIIQKTIDTGKDATWNVRTLRNQVTQGIIQGESMDDIAKRLEKVTDMNRKSAIRNARTMTTCAENKGRNDSYEKAEAAGLILEQEWVAEIDDRTRDSHIEINRETKRTGEKFSNGLEYPADPTGEPSQTYNCRCTLVSSVVGFRKLR